MKPSIRHFKWIPRILAIIAILIISLFALDSFGTEETFLKEFSNFSLHLVPAIILLVFLVVAWKRELIGGILFVIFGLGFIPLVYTMNHAMSNSAWTSVAVVLMVNAPCILVGILFILGHFLQKKNPE
jgi:hypothetical protein